MASLIGLSEALFVVGAAVVIIVPRTASSTDCIGGDLAAPYRQSVLILACMNVFRNVLFEDRRFRDVCPMTETEQSIDQGGFSTIVYYSLTSIESFSKCFLMLLMPYLLQKRLSTVINIRPGQDLLSWLQAILLLNVVGVIGAQYNSNLWAFKRLGDAIGCVPVITTLRKFRSVYSNSSERGNHMTIMTLEALEGYSLIVTSLAAAAYLFDDHHSVPITAIRAGSIFVSWTRAIFHGNLLNVMDDASYIAPPVPQESTTDFEQPAAFDDDDQSMLLVKAH